MAEVHGDGNQQLKYGDYNGSHKMAVVLTFSKGDFQPGHTLSFPPATPAGLRSCVSLVSISFKPKPSPLGLTMGRI